ncbi:MAG: putative metal-dependent hydrolase [Candidatus Azotimanducaceae bacterium]|jgi:predicted metal-dependent hydrolase
MSITNASPAVPMNRMTVRKVPFAFRSGAGHWNAAKPEFSQVVNSASLAMPYLEPYLIRTMREARPLISDPQLQRELDLYIKQEATHYKQHRQFNNTLKDQGYACIAGLEETLDKDYAHLETHRSLRFNLAYAEGFESMALALGEMLIEDRVYLFGDSDPAVASLVLWHFVEEIEHKNVAFDVFHHVYGSYFWRMVGLIYASGHIFWRTGQGYRALLKEDGLWQDRESRWTLLKLLGRLMGSIAPRWLRILRPGYHPTHVKDPAWGLRWAESFERSPDAVAHLNTADLSADIPTS